MMEWLYKRNETYIQAFDFKKLKRLDKDDEANRRSTFTVNEVNNITLVIADYIKEAEKNIEDKSNVIKAITGYYLGVAMVSGLRRGEQVQLRWKDVEDIDISG